MKQRLTKNCKSVIAILLAVSLCIGMIRISNPLEAGATSIETGIKNAAEDIVIDDFESGTEGESISGWSETAMDLDTDAKRDDPSFLDAFTLTTAIEDGNKVAELRKTGSGYVAATSGKVQVVGAQAYRLSFDYRTTDVSVKEGATSGTNYFGVRLLVEELDANGNSLGLKRYYTDESNKAEWSTGVAAFTTQASTASIITYLWMGGQWNMYATVRFDNVILQTVEQAEAFNGDFESGRDGYSVKGWSKTAMDYGSDAKRDDPTFLDAYILNTAVEDGNKVASLEKVGAGYVGVTSSEIQVAGGQDYRLSFDYRTVEVTIKEGATSGTNYHGVRLYVEEQDANGKSLGLTRHYYDESNNTNWSTGIANFQTQANTASVIIYLWMGGQWNMYATVYFDNVILEENDDYKVVNGTFDKKTYLADGGRAEGIAGPAGWTVVSCNNQANSFSGTYNLNYNATVVEEDGNAVMCWAANNDKTQGYAVVQSPYIGIGAEQEFSLQYDVKMVGTEAAWGTYAQFTYYNSAKEVIGTYHPAYIDSSLAGQGWKTIVEDNGDMKTLPGTAFIKVGFFAGGLWNAARDMKYYFDNVVLQVDDELSDWTEESCRESGVPYSGVDYTANYDIRKVSDGADHEEALQLYVSRSAGTGGGVVYYSQAIPVIGDEQYTTSFDLKIENSDTTGTVDLYGASYVLRYLDSDGNILNTGNQPQDLTGRLKTDMDWTHYTYDFIPPENTVAVQVGLVIGSYTWGVCKDLMYTWDNLILMESEAYKDYIKDPAVTSSSLYKQSALFVGDAIGNGMAEIASSYSEMVVTNACSANTSMEDQLSTHATGEFQYVVISVGDAEIKAQTPTGTVTDNSAYMNGVDFDTTTFAGLLEQTFAKVTEYYEPEKVVYVLPSNNATYKTIAEEATQKWGVALAVLSNTSDNVKNWNDVIEPAEQADRFDCYNILGLRVYLEDVVNDIADKTLSLEQMPVLEALYAKAEGCPTDHAEYQEYQALANEIEAVIAKYDEYRPTICGATIAEGDPNQLRFVAMSAKVVLPEGTQVKRMGILITPDIQDTSVIDVEATYTATATSYDAILSGEEVEPSVIYGATAYTIYEYNGREYAFYSNNDYVNALGETTAKDGTCEKSVYGVAKEIAVKLVGAKAGDMDFSAIGGVDNTYLIPEATEVSDVSLYDIYRLVSDNADVLKEWLGEGGVSR